VSENITVRSVVDRFLEHSRIYYFENACQPKIFVASADWMPRNFFRRIETAFPIEDGNLRERIISQVLGGSLADNVKARLLQEDRSYRRANKTEREKARRSQSEFMDLAQREEVAPSVKAGKKSRYTTVKLVRRPK
jgi:polyphosphate kinase